MQFAVFSCIEETVMQHKIVPQPELAPLLLLWW